MNNTTYHLHRYLIRFSDTMAYGTHHFLTNFRFQCAVREECLFATSANGSEPWREEISDIELLTQRGHCHNFKPVGLGEKVAVLMGVQGLGESSDYWLTFRVIDCHGAPITVGYQRIVLVSASDHTVATIPPQMREQLSRLCEPEGLDVVARIDAGGNQALSLFPKELCRQAAESLAFGVQGDTIQSIAADDSLAQTWLLCGGQGTGDASFLHAASERWPWAKDIIMACAERAQTLLGQKVDPFRENSGLYADQLAMYLTNVVAGQAVIGQNDARWGICGHSAGEIAALALGQAIDVIDGAEVIIRRSKSLADFAKPGGLIAVNSNWATVRNILAGLTSNVAVVNNEHQVVVAVPVFENDLVIERLTSAGLRITTLTSTPFPFHSASLLPSVGPFAEGLQTIRWSLPRYSVYSPMEKGPWLSANDMPVLLASHFIRPLDFASSMLNLIKRPGNFIDCTPRGVLAGLLRNQLQVDATRRLRTLKQVLDFDELKPKVKRLPLSSSEVGASSTETPELLTGDEQEVVAVIVGIGCCLPGAPDSDSYLEVLRKGEPHIRKCRELDSNLLEDFVTESLHPDKTYTDLKAAVLEVPKVSILDSEWSHMPRLARMAAAALDEALACCQKPDAVPVYIGGVADGCEEYDQALALSRCEQVGVSSEVIRSLDSDHQAYEPQAWLRYVATQLLAGSQPVCIDAACASGLYTVDLAMRCIRSGEASCAVAGGAFAPGFTNNCLFAQFYGLSTNGSFPLSSEADGVVFGEGAAFVVVKSLAEARRCGDRVMAVLSGSGLSSDGAGASVSKPKAAGQKLAIERAWNETTLSPSDVDLVEAHATGTTVGDAVEVDALSTFFADYDHLPGSLPVASVKSIIGHTGWASGTASLIKSVLAFENDFKPRHRRKGKPEFPENSPLCIAEQEHWPFKESETRSIAINSFGFGGANAHLILTDRPVSIKSHQVEKVVPVTRLFRKASVETIDTMRQEMINFRLLPDVTDSMDPSQILSIDATQSLLNELPGWQEHALDIAVIVGMPGKTAVIVGAADRILSARSERLLHEAGWTQPITSKWDERSPSSGPYTLTGGMPNITSGRVAQVFGLNGPNFVVDEGEFSAAAAERLARSLISDRACCAAIVLAIDPTFVNGCATAWSLTGTILASESLHRQCNWPMIAVGFESSSAVTCWTPELIPNPQGIDSTWNGTILDLQENSDADGESAFICRIDLNGEDSGLLSTDNERKALSDLRRACVEHYDAIASGRVAVVVISSNEMLQMTPHPATGLFAGFLKSLARELPSANFAAIHSNGAEVTEKLIRGALSEPGLSEWFVDSHRNISSYVLRPIVEMKPGKKYRMPGPILLTGGARGVTAVLADSLATQGCGPIVILGRSSPESLPKVWSEAEPDALESLVEHEIYDLVAKGESPRQARWKVDCYLALRELRDTIRSLQAHTDVKVDYRCCDLLEQTQVLTIVKAVTADYGKVSQIVHSAGVQVSQNLATKSEDDFERIIATKLDGLAYLLKAFSALDCSPSVSLASSAYSYIGNDGQQDYGAANEYFLRLATWRQDEGWKAIAWPAWAGIGMTSGGEYQALAGRRSMRGISSQEGAALFSRLSDPETCAASVVLSTSEIQRANPKRSPREITKVSSSRSIKPLAFNESQLNAINGHLVNGRPALPACFMVSSWLELLEPKAKTLRDIRFEHLVRINPQWNHSIKLDNGVLTLVGQMRAADGTVLVDHRQFAHAKQFSSQPQIPVPPTFKFKANASDPYMLSDSVVELGADWDCLKDIAIDPSGRVARYRPKRHNPALAGGSYPPLLVDAVLRLASMDPEHSGQTWVPIAVDKLIWNRALVEGDNELQLCCNPATFSSNQVTCVNAWVVDGAGEVLLYLNKMRGQLLLTR